MRLVCPNCDAEYEVDAAAIPLAGRDVQCSNCGHAWFQVHPQVDAGDEADVFDAVNPAAKAEDESAAPVIGAVPPVVPEPEKRPDVQRAPAVQPPVAVLPVAALPVPAPAMPGPSRSLDETVLAVLREEAEREAAARRAEAVVRQPDRAPVIETQTEMPLAQDQSGMAAAVKRIARLRGTQAEPASGPDSASGPVAPPPPKSRREMLPAIEDINSTLRATSDRTSDADAAILDSMGEPEKERAGFRRGFVMLVVLAVIAVGLYVLAPMIGVQVPALAGFAAGYVRAVDAARLGLDSELRSLIGALRAMAGGQGG